MAEEINAGVVESALESAFSGTEAPAKPAPAPAPAPEPVEALDLAEEEGDVQAGDGDDPADTVEAAPVDELELEIDIDGTPEIIRGNDRVKELVQKGLKAGRTFEENARVRDALAAHVQSVQAQTQFQQAVFQDVTQLQALDAQLAQYDQIDWNAAFDSDAFNALKLKEQRDQLRERRNVAVNQLNSKQQQFSAFQNESSQRVLAAESQALLAKLPSWRNSEKASTEQKAIKSMLLNAGFQSGELDGLTDHRAVLIARDAYLYRQLIANRDAKVKQVRAAPALAKPGAVTAQTNSRTDFQKARTKIKELGTKGNHRAQENIALTMFEKTFK